MRAHVKRGIPAWELQGRINQRNWARTIQNERGWPILPSAQQGVRALADAAWHRHYRLQILGKLLSPFEKQEHKRLWRVNMDFAAKCERPQLP